MTGGKFTKTGGKRTGYLTKIEGISIGYPEQNRINNIGERELDYEVLIRYLLV